MGMIRGVIKVTDNFDSVDTSQADSSIPTPSSGMSCCTGGAAGGVPETPSIYGDDLSKVTTDRLIKKAKISGNIQSISIKGKGYEFEPLVIVVQRGLKINLSIDFNEFDDVNGKFSIINVENNNEITSFTGKKEIVNVEFNLENSGTYLIVRDNVAMLGIEVLDSLKDADLEKVRMTYLG